MWPLTVNKEKQVRRSQKEMDLSRIDQQITAARDLLAEIERDIGKAYQKKAQVYEKTMEAIIGLDAELDAAGLSSKVPIKIGNVGDGKWTDIIAAFTEDPKLGLPKVAQGAIRKFLSGEKGDYLNSVIDAVVDKKLSEVGSKAVRKEIEA